MFAILPGCGELTLSLAQQQAGQMCDSGKPARCGTEGNVSDMEAYSAGGEKDRTISSRWSTFSM